MHETDKTFASILYDNLLDKYSHESNDNRLSENGQRLTAGIIMESMLGALAWTDERICAATAELPSSIWFWLSKSERDEISEILARPVDRQATKSVDTSNVLYKILLKAQ